MKNVRRGFVESDTIEFGKDAIARLCLAAEELVFLLNRGYPLYGAVTFVGDHYQFSKRQRMALSRSVATEAALWQRKQKRLAKEALAGQAVVIDGFNQIITLEVILSESVYLRAMDETIRDLAGLRGSYRIITQTAAAIKTLGEALEGLKIAKAVFFLDAPISNSGQLKQLIENVLQGYSFETEVILCQRVDTVLKQHERIISSDGIIIQEGQSWFNLLDSIVKELPQKKNEMRLFHKNEGDEVDE